MLARPARYASYLVLVHRPTRLLHAAFRPRLTTTPWRFAMTSPPSGCQRDFHPQAVEHARRTWFWGLLPKQKDLGCRDEPRQNLKKISEVKFKNEGISTFFGQNIWITALQLDTK